MSSLDPAEESLVSAWLLQKMPPNAETVAREWWHGLRLPALRRRLQAAESRLKLPQLSIGEEIALQREIFELRIRTLESQMQQPGLGESEAAAWRNRWLTCGGNSTTFHGFRRPACWSLDYGEQARLARILLFRPSLNSTSFWQKNRKHPPARKSRPKPPRESPKSADARPSSRKKRIRQRS